MITHTHIQPPPFPHKPHTHPTPPATHQFNKGRDNYDTSPKRRAPAWTDRVLFKPCNGAVECTHYDSVPSCRHSDHRPVLARFRVPLNRPTPEVVVVGDDAGGLEGVVERGLEAEEELVGKGGGDGDGNSLLLEEEEETEAEMEEEMEEEEEEEETEVDDDEEEEDESTDEGGGGESGYESDEEDSEY
jgi:hypothetical protein